MRETQKTEIKEKERKQRRISQTVGTQIRGVEEIRGVSREEGRQAQYIVVMM